MRRALRKAWTLLVTRLLVSIDFIDLSVLFRGIDVVIIAAVHVVLPLCEVFSWVNHSCLLFTHDGFSHLVVIEASEIFLSLSIMSIGICLLASSTFHRGLMLFIGILIIVIFLFVVLILWFDLVLVLSLRYVYGVSQGSTSLLLQRFLNFIGLQLHWWLLGVISVLVHISRRVLWLLVWSQLHKSFSVRFQLPNHMLLQ